MSPEEVVNLNSSVAELISVYHEGCAIIERIKAKRAENHAPPPPRVLDESVGEAAEEIERTRDNGIALIGKAFEEGDDTAVIALQRITIRLQGSLLRTLREAVDEDDDLGRDFATLVEAADSCRDGALRALTDLEKRLLSSDSSMTRSNGSLRSGRSLVHKEPVLKSSQESSPIRAIPQRPRRTWTREYSSSGDEDVSGGAEESQQHNRRPRHGTLLGFFKHHHGNSGSRRLDVDHSRHHSGSPTSAPSKSPPLDDQRNESFSSINAQEPLNLTHEEGDGRLSTNWTPSQLNGTPRRDTLSIPPDLQAPTHSSPPTALAMPPNSISSSSIAIPHPTPENDYLGFCKGAWRLQTGDRKAMKPTKEFNDGWSHSTVYYLACTNSKCAFGGHIDLDVIWTKVWKMRESQGVKFRWPFLAKSHVTQSKVKDHAFVYQCLFCVFLGLEAPVLHGTDLYIEHVVREHRGRVMSDVVLYKAGCVNDRVCDDEEEFDINLYPLSVGEEVALRSRKQSDVLSDELLIGGARSNADGQDMLFANEPWNEGLSEFHEGGEMERTERE